MKDIIPDETREDFLKIVEDIQKAFIHDGRNTLMRSSMIYKQYLDKLLTDEERAKFYNLPKGCRIRENAKIISPENFICGEFVWIGEGAILDASGGLEIGNHSTIGVGVLVWSHTSYLSNLAMSNYSGNPFIQRSKTTIGNGVYVVGPTVIYPGVTIGDKTVVLPMSTVTQSFAGNCMIGGSPAKKIKDISDEDIERQIEWSK